MTPRTWTEEYKIRSYEIGPSGYATPQSILRFLQETASNHVSQLDLAPDDILGQDQMWVLANLSLCMEDYPKWREKIVVKTWPVAHESAIRGYRDFLITTDDGEPLGKASTLWILLNRDTRKPLKLPGWIADIAGAPLEPKFLHTVKENEYPHQSTNTREFSIRGSDIDWNLHVNNVCYLDWALETMSAIFRLENKLTELHLSFLAEAEYGETVVLNCFSPADGDGNYLHRVENKANGKSLALLKMRWLPKEATPLFLSLQRSHEKR